MFSKIINFLIIICVMLVLASCRWIPGANLKIGESNPPSGKVAVDMDKFSCLRDLGNSLNEYFDSNLTESQIVILGDCLRVALKRFEFLTEDADDGTYTPNSLVNFINKEYLRDQKISQELATELMAIKALVLGGSTERISRTDLHELSKFISFIQKHAIAHLPYLKIYRRNSEADPIPVSKQDLLNAQQQVQVTARALAELFRQCGSPYSLKSFGRLIEQVRIFLKWDESHPNSKSTDQIMGVITSLKEIVTGDESETIRARDWFIISDAVSVSYGLLLNHEISMRGQTLTIDPALETFIGSINDSLMLIERVIEVQPNKVIYFSQTDKLLNSINRAGYLPEGIRESSLSSVYRYLVTHGLQSPRVVKGEDEIEGLSLSELKEISNEFKLWADAQRYLSDSATQAAGLNYDPTELIQPTAIQLLNSFRFVPQQSGSGFDVNLEIEKIIKNLPPIFKANDERAYIATNEELQLHDVQNGFSNLTKMNFMRALVRLLIRSFASQDRVISMSGVTESEMETFYETTKSLGEDLKLMEPPRFKGKNEKGKKYFIEGKMFSRRGEGVTDTPDDEHDILSFYETMELLSMMWSGGQIRNVLYDEISEKCTAEGFGGAPFDILGSQKINRECFSRHLSDNNFEEFSNLPGLKISIQALSKRQEQNFINDMQGIAKISCEDEAYIEQSELAVMST
ncbi:MAG: hypothetical protein KDD38_08830, partial [Bdellovibrionales bacterium]|nr:hypothetical protein [Bdellovibrionales bacterium]